MSVLEFDQDAAARLTAVYVTPDVIAQRAQLLEVMGLCVGDRVLDAGCDAGFLTLELAERVGASGRVTGVDKSPVQLGLAAARCKARSWVAFREADATQLPCGNGELDVVVSAQVLEYVTDVGQALRELARVVRPGGTISSLEFSVPPPPVWLPLWRLYTRVVLPVGGFLGGGRAWATVGRFLGPSIEEHYRRYPVDTHVDLWRDAGLVDVQARSMSLGGGLVMWGRKPDG